MSNTLLLDSYIGDYRIIDFLGAGGMGSVYQAVHSKIGRVVAIKLLSQSVSDQSFIERFINEARIQASLNHPNVATLYDFLEFQGQPCIIMEYIEGKTLSDHISASGALSSSEAVAILKSIVEAIHYVHGLGIIHRDIKSNNVKITSGGHVKLLDFGIAKSGSSPDLTVTGGVIGTLQYLSPEQFKGGRANVQTDIWALGVLFYEMVTGYMPFEATTIGELYEKLNKAAFTPPSALNASVPRELENIIHRCLKKNPSDRYQSAQELLQDIDRCASPTYAPPRQQTNHFTAFISKVISSPVLNSKTKSVAIPRIATLPKVNRYGFALPVVAVTLLIIFGLYSFLGSSSELDPNDPQMRRYTVDVSGGRADVYKDGEKIGSTPYKFKARLGDQIEMNLRREGFEDYPIRMTVSEHKYNYLYTMQEKE